LEESIQFTFLNDMLTSPAIVVCALFALFEIGLLLWHGKIDIDLRNLKIIGKGGKDKTAD
jgi:hypothetical protein